MDQVSTYTGPTLVEHLESVLGTFPAGTQFPVALSGTNSEISPRHGQAGVMLARYSEADRRITNTLGALTRKTGCVQIYGDSSQDAILTLAAGDTPMVLRLDEAILTSEGLFGTMLRLRSPGWKHVREVIVFTGPILTGDVALDVLKNDLLARLGDGVLRLQFGTWVTKRTYDRNLPRVEQNRLAIRDALREPDRDWLVTSILSPDLVSATLTTGDQCHFLKVQHPMNTYSIEFIDLIVVHRIPSHNRRLRNAMVSNCYLLGTPISERINFIRAVFQPT